MTAVDAETRRMLEVLAVRQRLERYFSCVDRRDWTGLGECFTHDAHAVYNSGTPTTLEGRAAVVERLRIVERFVATNHILSNADISVGGATARSVTQAIAHILVAGDTGRRVLVRGLRYSDELALEDGTWRIRRRLHEPLWQYEADAVDPKY